jgi:AcrR family transcriptional regulator
VGPATRKRRYAPRLPPAERREQLLDAALQLIGERGYAGVSMEGVARAAGVTKPVVYDSFANLDALLRALLDREEERALAQLAAAMPADREADPDELAVAGFVAFLRSVAANPTTWRLILMPAEGTPAAVRDHVDAGRESIRGQLEELVAWGVARRGGPQGLDRELAAGSLVAVGEHLARLTLSQPREFTPERAGEFVRGLLAAL